MRRPRRRRFPRLPKKAARDRHRRRRRPCSRGGGVRRPCSKCWSWALLVQRTCQRRSVHLEPGSHPRSAGKLRAMRQACSSATIDPCRGQQRAAQTCGAGARRWRGSSVGARSRARSTRTSGSEQGRRAVGAPDVSTAAVPAPIAGAAPSSPSSAMRMSSAASSQTTREDPDQEVARTVAMARSDAFRVPFGRGTSRAPRRGWRKP